MKQLTLNVLIICSLVSTISAQNWEYSKGGDAFDGKYRTSSIKGVGNEFPYEEPVFVVNRFLKSDNINVYLNDVGYAGCDSKYVKITFDNDNKVYLFDASTDTNKDAWFLSKANFADNTISKSELLKKLMSYYKMHVRISSDCGERDFEFSLNGSSQAINYVLPDNYFKENDYNSKIAKGDKYLDQKAYDKAIKEYSEAAKIYPNKKEPEDKINTARNLKRLQKVELSFNDTLRAKVSLDALVYDKPDHAEYYEDEKLNTGEKVIVTEFLLDKEFCKLVKADSITDAEEKSLYIKTMAVDKKTISIIHSTDK